MTTHMNTGIWIGGTSHWKTARQCFLRLALVAAACSLACSNDSQRPAENPSADHPPKRDLSYLPPLPIDPEVDRLWKENIAVLEAVSADREWRQGDYARAVAFLEETSGITAHDDRGGFGIRLPLKRVTTEDLPRWREWYRANAQVLYFDTKTQLIRINHDAVRVRIWTEGE